MLKRTLALATMAALFVSVAACGDITVAGDQGDIVAPDASLTDTGAADAVAPDVAPPSDVHDAGTAPDIHDTVAPPDVPLLDVPQADIPVDASAPVDIEPDAGLPEGCCWRDDDCGPEKTCRGALPGQHSGVCVALPPTGECWAGRDCDEGVCVGARVCGCGTDCVPRLGDCEIAQPGCCSVDRDCDGGDGLCVGGDNSENSGRCAPLPLAGECYRDLDCPDSRCSGAVICGCGDYCEPLPGLCEPVGPTCCEYDAECGGDFICLGATGDGADGVCAPSLTSGECYRNAECASGICVGATVCGCDDPVCLPAAGMCEPTVPGCCWTADECGTDHLCIGNSSDGPGGQCVPRLSSGECFIDSDCDSGVCEGALVCNCEEDCVATPGVCGTVNPGCCDSDIDCPRGRVCAGGRADGSRAGACKEQATGELCWSDGECTPDEFCAGVTTCGCATCSWTESPGTCLPKHPASGCCYEDDDCAQGNLCAASNVGWRSGICSDSGVGGFGCYHSGHCPSGQVCHGAYAIEGCSDAPEPARAGACGPPDSSCCYGDSDCADGMRCARPDLNDTTRPWGFCAPSVPDGELEDTCYVDDDCADGWVCWGQVECFCGDTNCRPESGMCSRPTRCSVESDCGWREVCAGVTAEQEGYCRRPAAGNISCWSTVECAPGTVCMGALACTYGGDCPAAELPGVCR